MLQDNLLKIAEQYHKSLEEEDEDIIEDEVSACILFERILNDYKKMMKSCKKEGHDVGDIVKEVKEMEMEYKTCDTLCEKQNFFSRVKDRIVCLIEICNDTPKHIAKKYCDKDLFDLFEE